MKFLDNFSIPAKLTIAFGILVSALALVAVVGIFAINQAFTSFVDYRALARQANADGRVQANMLSTRVFVKDFVQDPSADSVAGVNERAQATIELITEAIALAEDPVYDVILRSLNEDLIEYTEHFATVVELQEQRDELVNDALNSIGPLVEQDLTGIMRSALDDGDTEASYLAGTALRSLLLGRLYANRFLIQNDDDSYDRAVLEFRNFDSEMDLLDASLENPVRRELLQDAMAAKALYYEALEQVQDVILARNDLIDNRLDRIGPRVADEIEELKLAIQSEQDAMGPIAQSNLNNSQILTVTLTLLAAFFGITVAFFVGRAITRPLGEITSAADAFAAGEIDQDVNTDRADEIGRLGKAFVTMRETLKEQVESLQSEISTREEAEKEAAQQRQVFMDSSVPIIIEDLNGNIIDANQEAIRTYGYMREELIGQPIKILVPDEFHGQADELLRQSRTGNEVRDVEGVRWNKFHEHIPVELTFSQLLDVDGKITALATTAKDIRKQKEIQQTLDDERESLERTVEMRTSEVKQAMIKAEELRDQAESATEAKANFLATMSHEIRTPMNGIIGMVDLLRQSDLGPEHQKMLQTISESGYSLVSIINDILDFSKVEAGKLEIENIPFNLLDLVEGVVDNLAPIIRQKNLKVTLFIDPKIPQFIMGDPVRVRQILMNLGSNAVKFSEDGEVEFKAEFVTAENGEQQLVMRVVDDGIGISAEAQSRLFTAFDQAETSTTRKYGGTGLGLSICKRLTELMKGDIQVNSILGEGSEFVVSLPLEPSDKQIEIHHQSDLKGLTILVLGSDKKELGIARSYLEHWHAKVEISTDIENVLTTVKNYKHKYPNLDLVILGSSWLRTEQVDLRDVIHAEPGMENLKVVLLMQGRRTQPRLDNPDTISLDINPLKRIAFLTAVSIATGRASPEAFHVEEVEDLNVAMEPLSIEEAIKEKALILVAEDNLTNQDVIRRQLNMLGYTCEMADNGVEALRHWRTGRASILLTDCHMPEMDGYTLAESVRSEEKVNDDERAPIIAITANALQGEAQRCLAHGMDDYLSKPLELKLLRDKLRQWMPHFRPESKADKSASESEPSASGNADRIKANGDGNAVDVVDLSVLRGLIGGDDEALREVLNDFIDPSLQIISELKSAHEAQSSEEVKQAAHKLKSSARSIGANELADLCMTLEDAGKENDMATISSNIGSIDPLMEQVVSYIRSM